MRIFISIHHYPPRFTGGAELRAHRTALALQKRGHTVQVIAIERIDDGPNDRVLWDDDVYEGVPIRRIRFNKAATPDRFTYSYNNPWIGEHLSLFLREFNPDVVHYIGGYLQSASAIRAAVNLGIPTVLSLTDYWFLCNQIQLINRDNKVCKNYMDPACCLQCYAEEKRRYRWLGNMFPELMRMYWKTKRKEIERFHLRRDYLMETLNLVDTIIAPSNFIGEFHVNSGVERKRVSNSRQGRTFQNLEPDILNKEPSPILRLAYIGQLIEIKGVHVILNALRHLPDAPLTMDIFGDLDKQPKYVKKLRHLAARDQRVRFHGLFSHNQVSEIFHTLDAVIVPSLWYENSPNVILEAFAHQTPVIASNLGAMPELVIDEECGLLFEAGNAKSLADKMKRLMDDANLLSKLTAGIPPVKTEDQEIDELEVLYQKLGESRQKSR